MVDTRDIDVIESCLLELSHGCDQYCVASQAVRRSVTLPRKRENGPRMPAFRAFAFVSGLPNQQSQGAKR
jgi:hypothetical protein